MVLHAHLDGSQHAELVVPHVPEGFHVQVRHLARCALEISRGGERDGARGTHSAHGSLVRVDGLFYTCHTPRLIYTWQRSARQRADHRIAKLRRRARRVSRPHQISSEHASFHCPRYSILNRRRRLLHTKRVSQQHRSAQDLRGGVGHALAGDVRRRAARGLVPDRAYDFTMTYTRLTYDLHMTYVRLTWLVPDRAYYNDLHTTYT